MLKGKTAVVTGSTSGIGLGIARALAAEGYDVALNSFAADAQSDALVKEMAEKYGVRCMFAKADMSKPAEVVGMVKAVEAAWGRLDILVNNAGIQHVAPIDDFPDAKWEQILSINLSSAFYSTKAALPGMKARKWGRIVNIASAHGLVASAFKSAYVAAKHGMVGFTKVTALETATFGITANTICPGYVWTPLVAAQIPDQAKTHNMTEEEVIQKVLLKEQPTGRFASVEEIGALTVFLASDGGASVTGTAIPVDGGWTAH
jgi:3-hydroxybutyrate dehydrogenase